MPRRGRGSFLFLGDPRRSSGGEAVLKRFLLWSHYLSLDVSVGAVAASVFAAAVLDSPARPALYLVLFLAVYGIYNLDHAIDASGGHEVLDPRRRFHRRNCRWLWLSSTTALLCASGAALYLLRVEVLRAGIALGAFMAVYLGVIYLRIPTAWKELFTAAGYTAGIWLPHAALTRDAWLGAEVPLALIFPLLLFLSCLLNLYAYAEVDRETDRAMGQSSLAQHRTSGFTRSVNFLLVLVGLVLIGIGVAAHLPLLYLFISGIHLAVQYALTLEQLQASFPGAIRQIGETSYWIFLLALG